jgi:hypothetical protein
MSLTTWPYGVLHTLSPQRFPDLATTVERLSDPEDQNGALSRHHVRLQCEGYAELSPDLVSRIAREFGAEAEDTQWLADQLTAPVASSSEALRSVELLRERALAGATFRSLR